MRIDGNGVSHTGLKQFVSLVEQFLAGSCRRVLIAGCGSDGREVRAAARVLPGEIWGLDLILRENLSQRIGRNWHLVQGDVQALPFQGEVFDAVFYHHVLEHVTEPERSLAEIARVLRPGGWLYLGTPNRSRLIGYLGAQATWKERLLWNLYDYQARLQGRFRNELGAHAGFTEEELTHMLEKHFHLFIWVTREYLQMKYKSSCLRPLLFFLLRPQPLLRFAAPSLYVWAQKAPTKRRSSSVQGTFSFTY